MKRIIIPFVFLFFIVSVYAQTAGGGGGATCEVCVDCKDQGYISLNMCKTQKDKAVEEKDKEKFQVMMIFVLVGSGLFYFFKKKPNKDFTDEPFTEESEPEQIDFGMIREGLKEQRVRVEKLEQENKDLKKEKMDDKYFK